MRYIPAVLVVTLLFAAMAAGAWGLQDSTLSSGRFRVESETVTEASDLFVKRLRIVANGAGGVRLTHGDGDASWLSLANTSRSEDGMQRVDLVFVADKSLDLNTEYCSITWLEQITTRGGTRVGGPSRRVVPHDIELDEFAKLELPDGEYSIGETLHLGIVGTEAVEVTVERLERAVKQE